MVPAEHALDAGCPGHQRQRLLGIRERVRARVRDHRPQHGYRIRGHHLAGQCDAGGLQAAASQRLRQPVAERQDLPHVVLRGERGRRRHPGLRPCEHRPGRHHGAAPGDDRWRGEHPHDDHQRAVGLPLPDGRQQRGRHPHLRARAQSRIAHLHRAVVRPLRARWRSVHVHRGSLRRQGDLLRLRRPGHRIHADGHGHHRCHEQVRAAEHLALHVPAGRLLPPGVAHRRPPLRLHQRRDGRERLPDLRPDTHRRREQPVGANARGQRESRRGERRPQPLCARRPDVLRELPERTAHLRHRGEPGVAAPGGLLRHAPRGGCGQLRGPLDELPVLPQRHGDRRRHEPRPLRVEARSAAGHNQLSRGSADARRARRRRLPGGHRARAWSLTCRGQPAAALRPGHGEWNRVDATRSRVGHDLPRAVPRAAVRDARELRDRGAPR